MYTIQWKKTPDKYTLNREPYQEINSRIQQKEGLLAKKKKCENFTSKYEKRENTHTKFSLCCLKKKRRKKNALMAKRSTCSYGKPSFLWAPNIFLFRNFDIQINLSKNFIGLFEFDVNWDKGVLSFYFLIFYSYPY